MLRLPLRSWYFLLPLVLILRILYGSARFGVDDALQIFLIGFKYYTHGVFPYWGPDVVYTASQIPGALQGLLTGAPLWIWPSAWAPLILLNLLSFSALGVFAWYISRRFPALPTWLPWLWVLMTPWSLQYSTHIENPSYVLAIAALFWTAVLDLSPVYERPLLPARLCFFVLGCSLGCMVQLHLSWVLLPPYIAWCLWTHRQRASSDYRALACLILGLLLPLLGLLPGILTFGRQFGGGAEHNLVLNWDNALMAPVTILRFFSYSTYEVLRFAGNHVVERLHFLNIYAWAAPFTVFLFMVGMLQLIWLIWCFFQKNETPGWTQARRLTGLTLLFLCTIQVFSVAKPWPHTYIALFPLSVWYSFYCYAPLSSRRWFKPLAILVLGSGAIFQLARAMSLYPQYGIGRYKEALEKGFAHRDYTFVGLRRESAFEQQHLENPWHTTQTPDGKLMYSTGFEVAQVWCKPQNIVPLVEARPDNRWQCKVSTFLPYTLTISLPDSIGRRYQSARVSARYRAGAQALDLCMVTEWKQGDKSLHWQSVPLQWGPAIWQPVDFSVSWPPAPKEADRLMLYLWWKTPDPQAPIYLDDVEIVFSP